MRKLVSIMLVGVLALMGLTASPALAEDAGEQQDVATVVETVAEDPAPEVKAEEPAPAPEPVTEEPAPVVVPEPEPAPEPEVKADEPKKADEKVAEEPKQARAPNAPETQTNTIEDPKPWICHPVNGKGELGNGWNLIEPDKASSHINEGKYPDGTYWKHISNDKLRHDRYADPKQGGGWTCPGEPIEGEDEVVTEWHTWEVPGTPKKNPPKVGEDVDWPQSYVGPGQIQPTKCGVWYQQDKYKAKQSVIDALWADDKLEYGEDHAIVKEWKFVYGGDCPPMPEPKSETRPAKKLNCGALTKLTWTEERTQTFTLVDNEWVASWGDWTKVEGSEKTVDALWTECPFSLATSHETQCGAITVSLENHTTWLYRVLIEVETEPGVWVRVGPSTGDPKWQAAPGVLMVDNLGAAPNHQTGSYTAVFPEDSGTRNVRYKVSSGTEADLYVGKPVGQFTYVPVATDCIPDAPVPTVEVEDQRCTTGDEGVAQYTPGSVTIGELAEGVSVKVLTYPDLGKVEDQGALPPGDYVVIAEIVGNEFGELPKGWEFGGGGENTHKALYFFTVESAEDCTVEQPETPEPTYTEWVDGEWACYDTTVKQTRTKTTYGWVWDSEQVKWVEDEPVETVEYQIRALTEGEILDECLPPPFEDVTYGEWSDGDFECDDTEVTQYRTKSVWSIPYIIVWEQGESLTYTFEADYENAVLISTTVEEQTRELATDEVEACPVPELAFTGSDSTGLLGVGALLTVLGTAAVAAVRRKRA